MVEDVSSSRADRPAGGGGASSDVESARVMDLVFKSQASSKRLTSLAQRLRDALGPDEKVEAAVTAKLAPTLIGGNGVLALTDSQFIHVEESLRNQCTYKVSFSEITHARVTNKNNNPCLIVSTRTQASDQEFIVGTGAMKSMDVRGRERDAAMICERILSKIEMSPLRGLPTLEFKKVDYLGGLQSAEPATNVILELSPSGIAVFGKAFQLGERGSRLFQLPWDQIDSVTVEGPEQFERRVTATRLLTVGLLAFAWKKKSGQSFITATSGGGDIAFFVDGKTPMEVGPQIQPYQRMLEASRPAKPGTRRSQDEQDPLQIIQQLQTLRESGALTEEEFQEKKAEQLKRI